VGEVIELRPRYSPADEVDRDWIIGFTWTPALLDDYAGRARQIAARLGGIRIERDRRTGGPIEAGNCDDCSRPAPSRWPLGHFKLCGACVDSRLRVAAGLERAAAGRAAPSPSHDWEGEEP
jgi:hypothetical protein